MLKSKQGGFTLIELVVVIVILGILAGFAVPRFMGLETQARAATVNSMTGTVRSTASMAHGVWLANGLGAASITVDGTAYPMTFGYPTVVSISTLMQDTAGFTTTTSGNVTTFTRAGATTPASCRVTYTQPTTATGVTSVPVIVGVASGC